MIVIKEHIATGRTIEEAIASGISELCLDRDSVSVEVVETPKKGFLGLGGTPARVKLTYEVDLPDVAKPAPKPTPKPEPKPELRSAPKPEPKLEQKPEPKPEPKPPAKTGSKAPAKAGAKNGAEASAKTPSQSRSPKSKTDRPQHRCKSNRQNPPLSRCLQASISRSQAPRRSLSSQRFSAFSAWRLVINAFAP